MVKKQYKQSKEHRKKIGIANARILKGRICSQKGLNEIIKLNEKRRTKNMEKYGSVHSPETRKKISETWKEKWANGEITEKQKNNLVLCRRGGEKSRFKKGHRQSKESREKMKMSTIKYIQDNPQERFRLKEMRSKQIFPKKDTKIEIKIQKFLKQLGKDFFTHQYINIKHGYQCDILIPSMNMVIECDGDYWHKYPIGNEVDHIRTEELLKDGFRVLRLWECEIKSMKINDFKERIK